MLGMHAPGGSNHRARCWLLRCLRFKQKLNSLCGLLGLAFFSFTAENFFSVRNITNVLGQASLALIAGIGCAIVFISGEVDISIGSLVAAIALGKLGFSVKIVGEIEDRANGRTVALLDGREGHRFSFNPLEDLVCLLC